MLSLVEVEEVVRPPVVDVLGSISGSSESEARKLYASVAVS